MIKSIFLISLIPIPNKSWELGAYQIVVFISVALSLTLSWTYIQEENLQRTISLDFPVRELKGACERFKMGYNSSDWPGNWAQDSVEVWMQDMLPTAHLQSRACYGGNLVFFVEQL